MNFINKNKIKIMRLLFTLIALNAAIFSFSQTTFSSNYYQVIGSKDSLSMTFTPHANFQNGFNIMGAVVNRQTIISLDTFVDVNFSNNTFIEKLHVSDAVFTGHINMQHVVTEKAMNFENCKLDLCNFLASDFKNLVSFKNTSFGGNLNIDFSQFHANVDFANSVLPDTITAVQLYAAQPIDFTVADFTHRGNLITVIIDKDHLKYIKIDNHFKTVIQ